MPETIFAIVWSGMSGKRLPAELVEDEVGAVAEVEELEVVLADAVESLEQAVVGDEEHVAGAEAAALGDDRLVLVLGQLGNLERLELADLCLDLLHASGRRARPSARSSSRRASRRAPPGARAPPRR